MSPEEMLAVYQRHRAAEEDRDYPRVMETLTPDCFLEHVSLELRATGRDAATKAYEELFAAFPDLGPIPEGIAFDEDVLVAFGQLRRTMEGPWLGLEPTGRSFTVPLVNVVPFRDGLMHGERLFYDVAMLCERAALDVAGRRSAARRLKGQRRVGP